MKLLTIFLLFWFFCSNFQKISRTSDSYRGKYFTANTGMKIKRYKYTKVERKVKALIKWYEIQRIQLLRIKFVLQLKSHQFASINFLLSSFCFFSNWHKKVHTVAASFFFHFAYFFSFSFLPFFLLLHQIIQERLHFPKWLLFLGIKWERKREREGKL